MYSVDRIFFVFAFFFFLFVHECCMIVRIVVNSVYMVCCRVTCVRVSVYGTFTCVTAVGSENLLAGLGKCHPGKGRGEGFRVHLAARALQVIILPCLCVRRLKHQPTRPHVIKLSWSTSRVNARRKSISCVWAATLPGENISHMFSKREIANRPIDWKKFIIERNIWILFFDNDFF